MSNVHHSRLEKSEIGHTLNNTVSILVSGEDSGWFVDSNVSLFSSDSLLREKVKVRQSSDSRKGQVAMWGEVTFPELDIGDGDDSSEGDEDDDNDGDDGVQTDSVILWLF